jgi:diketogulonate reductase-like aldo/keto reductase
MLAAKLLLFEPNPKFPIYISVNNQAAIKSSGWPSSKPGHYMLYKLHRITYIAHKHHNLTREQIIVNWIPSHEEIPGNEKADQEARKAASNPSHNNRSMYLPSFLRDDPLPSSISVLK